GDALKRQPLGGLYIAFHGSRPPWCLGREQSVERHGGDGHASAVPGKLVVGRLKRVDFEEGRAGLGGGDHPQRLDAAKETRALERGNQAAVILILRLDGDHVAAISDPFSKAEREEADLGADVEDQRSVV